MSQVIVQIVAPEPVRYSLNNGITLSEFAPREHYQVPDYAAAGMIKRGWARAVTQSELAQYAEQAKQDAETAGAAPQPTQSAPAQETQPVAPQEPAPTVPEQPVATTTTRPEPEQQSIPARDDAERAEDYEPHHHHTTRGRRRQ